MIFPSATAFRIGEWPVQWYGLSYGVGFILAWLYVRMWVGKGKFSGITCRSVDGFINWAIIGVIVGGRLGNVLFYYPKYYLHHLLEIFAIWKPGMSFHGGLVGVIIALFVYCKRHKLQFWTFADCWACAAPIGLFLGRLANFVNQELYGRITNSPFGIIFPEVDSNIRHPSQLYEAALEGAALFVILGILVQRGNVTKKHGFLSGLFLLGYGVSRWFVEYFREPLEISTWFPLTLGQLYSLPLILCGINLCVISWYYFNTREFLH